MARRGGSAWRRGAWAALAASVALVAADALGIVDLAALAREVRVAEALALVHLGRAVLDVLVLALRGEDGVGPHGTRVAAERPRAPARPIGARQRRGSVVGAVGSAWPDTRGAPSCTRRLAGSARTPPAGPCSSSSHRSRLGLATLAGDTRWGSRRGEVKCACTGVGDRAHALRHPPSLAFLTISQGTGSLYTLTACDDAPAARACGSTARLEACLGGADCS